MKKFSIITPCFNAEKYIAETICSIINQKAVQNSEVSLEYIICDGGSTDNTLKIVDDIFNNRVNCTLIVSSSKDKGMYDAISKGLLSATGDYCAYINAGDYYSPYAFDIILSVFSSEKIKWTTGIKINYNELSQVVDVRIPLTYRQRFIRRGYYGRILPFMQQESMFWKKELNALIDYNFLSDLQVAGDFFMWHCFAKKNKLYIVEGYIAGFKIHKGQKSEDHSKYRKEMSKFAKINYALFILDLPLILLEISYYIPDILRNILNSKTLIPYDHKSASWKIPE